jgi:hypothetical protein
MNTHSSTGISNMPGASSPRRREPRRMDRIATGG